MKELKRDTTIAKRFPVPLSPPSTAGISGLDGRSIFIFSFVFLSPRLESNRRRDAACRVSGCVQTRRGKPRLFSRSCLLPLEPRSPFLQKRRGPFLLILGSAADAKQSSLQQRPFGQRHLHALVDRFHSELHRQRSVRDDLSRNRLRPRN